MLIKKCLICGNQNSVGNQLYYSFVCVFYVFLKLFLYFTPLKLPPQKDVETIVPSNSVGRRLSRYT